MKKQFWLITFIVVLVADITGIQFNNDILQYISKPLMIPALTGYFLSQTSGIADHFKKWIVFALLFSWGGDVLLMFQAKREIFFLPGLSSFLLAHVFYIVFFQQVRVTGKIKSNPWFLVMVVIYYAALISWLSPYLGEMKIPVRIYGIVISFMFMLAMHMLFIKNKSAGKWMMVGALLFVISDSVLAINKFYQPFETAGVLIMTTYGLAQLFIVEGAIRYLSSAHSK